MAAKRTEKLVLRNSKIVLTSTVFDSVNDTVDVAANVPDELIFSKYVRRHVVFKGGFKASFANTGEADEFGGEGYVFPTRETYKIHNYKYQITALEDGSIYYCVLPGYSDHRLNEEVIDLAAGQTYEIQNPKVAFVFGTNYTSGSQINNATKVFCCENSSLTITANDPCKLLVYSTFKITAI